MGWMALFNFLPPRSRTILVLVDWCHFYLNHHVNHICSSNICLVNVQWWSCEKHAKYIKPGLFIMLTWMSFRQTLVRWMGRSEQLFPIPLTFFIEWWYYLETVNESKHVCSWWSYPFSFEFVATNYTSWSNLNKLMFQTQASYLTIYRMVMASAREKKVVVNLSRYHVPLFVLTNIFCCFHIIMRW